MKAPGFTRTVCFRLRGYGIAAVCSVILATADVVASPLSTEQVDRHLAARWDNAKASGASVADDGLFVRRIYLDLIGRIPTAGEARQFIDDPLEDKRRVLVSRLLNTAAHARYAATVWRRQWIPQADLTQPLLADEIEIWLASQIRAGVGFDQIVRELLSSPSKENGPPTTFLKASEFKPENLAANSTRAFLGINLDCAQCHDHPFSRWTRDQFWETAAFFNRPGRSDSPKTGLEIAIPGLHRSVSPRFLAGAAPTWPEHLTDETGRKVFADWITSKQNPYFARNVANRIWAQFFGTGLVEPIDDLNHENPASHPELLDDLAQGLIEQNFDVKALIATLVTTHAYQLSSAQERFEAHDERLFARSIVRGLSGEQLYDSLRIAAGLPSEREDLDPQNALRERNRFAERFRVERAANAQRSILQSLSLMNGTMTSELTDVDKSPTLRAVSESPFLDTQGRIEALFLATFSRSPSDQERMLYVEYVDCAQPPSDMKSRLADIFWAMLNSAEFSTNH